MVEMGVGEQHEVDRAASKPNAIGVFLREFAGCPAAGRNRSGSLPAASTRWHEPVTSAAAPWNDSFMRVAFRVGVQRCGPIRLPPRISVPDLLGGFGEPEQLAVLRVDDALVDQEVESTTRRQ